MDGAPRIPGTVLFDGEMARRGYALNKMCFSLNSERNRQAFLADESVVEVHRNYHVPISNTAAGLLAMAPVG